MDRHPKAREPELGWLLDLLLVVLLTVASLPVFWNAARGDLWFDEADYALAATRGFQANRWDRSENPAQPEKLVRLRHYHPPMVAHSIRAAFPWGKDDRTVRFPYMLAGALAVALVYLCALPLFASLLRPRGQPAGPGPGAPGWIRVPALACAVIVLITPAHIRVASHALPWSWIAMWLLALLWTLLKYVETGREAWLVGAAAALGGMFVTSEYFFPTAAAAVAAMPFLIWRDLRARESGKLRRLLLASAAGAAVFLLIGLLVWPAGLLGGAFKMLRHYMEMADDPSFPVRLAGQTYDRAPKWAYLYWYWNLYPQFTVLYGLGFLTALGLLLFRRLTPELGILGAFAGAILAVSHRSHIIGPQYLSHALPFLTLVGGLALVALFRRDHRVAVSVPVACALFIGTSPPAPPLAGMEPRSQHSRWPAAARFLAGRWRPGDRMLASQYGVAARWYVVHAVPTGAREWQVQALPATNAREKLLEEIVSGYYRYIAVGNTFTDYTVVDNQIRMILRSWPVIWRSDEGGAGKSRLVIYQLPKGVTRHSPLPLPPGPPGEDPDAWLDEWLL